MFDSPLTGSVKGEMSLMEYPFFDLSKRGRTRAFAYDDGQVQITVRAPDGQIATIYDKDILIYIASLMVAKMNEHETPPQTFTFTAHDYIRVTGKNASGRGYEQIVSAIERLQGTQIKTNIETGGEGVTGFFSWLEKADINYTVNKSKKRVMKSITVRLCDFIYRSILNDGHFLTYDPKYFDLSPLERRVYEIARKHCGHQDGFRIRLGKLHAKTGSESSLKLFKQNLNEISERDAIPEYHVGIVGDPRSPLTRRLEAIGFEQPKRRQRLNDLMVMIIPKNTAPTGHELVVD